MKKNDKTIIKYFQYPKRLKWKKPMALFVVSIESLKSIKYHVFLKRHI